MARRLAHMLHPKDNVATTLVPLEPGMAVTVEPPLKPGQPLDIAPVTVEVQTAIPFGHKVALRAIAAGQPVTKYGETIGLATDTIAPGEHVHVHNVESQRGRGDLVRGTSP